MDGGACEGVEGMYLCVRQGGKYFEFQYKSRNEEEEECMEVGGGRGGREGAYVRAEGVSKGEGMSLRKKRWAREERV